MPRESRCVETREENKCQERVDAKREKTRREYRGVENRCLEKKNALRIDAKREQMRRRKNRE